MEKYTNKMSKHKVFDLEEHNSKTVMGKLINVDEFSAQPAGDGKYADLSEHHYIGENEEVIPVEPIDLTVDRGLTTKLRPGSLLPDGDTE